jgi:hypothetical protein
MAHNHSLLIDNTSLENVAKFKHLVATVANEICIHEINSRLNSGNACYHSFRLLSKNLQITDSACCFVFVCNLVSLKLKGKGKFVPVLNQAPRHEGVLGEWRYSSTHSLTWALDGGEWSASRLGRFSPRERVTVREEHRLRIFENRVLRRMFGSMREEVAGSW